MTKLNINHMKDNTKDNTKENMKIINHFLKYMKDTKIFQHMILIILVIYRNHLSQIMIICNIHQHMFIIIEIYGNINDLQKKE